ncbi:unnamed protein product, partial [Amoebophrya sp. A25]|eukprot:GSA25T00001497001.1
MVVFNPSLLGKTLDEKVQEWESNVVAKGGKAGGLFAVVGTPGGHLYELQRIAKLLKPLPVVAMTLQHLATKLENWVSRPSEPKLAALENVWLRKMAVNTLKYAERELKGIQEIESLKPGGREPNSSDEYCNLIYILDAAMKLRKGGPQSARLGGLLAAKSGRQEGTQGGTEEGTNEQQGGLSEIPENYYQLGRQGLGLNVDHPEMPEGCLCYGKAKEVLHLASSPSNIAHQEQEESTAQIPSADTVM